MMMVSFVLTSAGPRSEIDRYAEASSVSSDVSNPIAPKSALNAPNLAESWSRGMATTDSIAADSYDFVILENATNLSIGYLP